MTGTAKQATESPTLKRRLGRGLNALLGSADPAELDEPAGESKPAPVLAPRSRPKRPQIHVPTAGNTQPVDVDSTGRLEEIDVEQISTNPYQPRKEFDEAGIEELAASIRQHGVLQPLLVRETRNGYQLIAGERRWRAAKRAELATVPCRVMELDDRSVCEASIEENLKRRDLNPLEKAEAFKEYLTHFDSTIEELAKHLSMSRSAVSNTLRLLDLAPPVREALKAGVITGGHARSLLSLSQSQQWDMCKRIQLEALSVRKTEQAVRELLNPETADNATASEAKATKPKPSNHVISLQDKLREKLGMKVEISLKSKDAGKITLHFASNDDFERLIRSLRDAA